MDHVAIGKLRKNRPLTVTDVAELERMLVEIALAAPDELRRAAEKGRDSEQNQTKRRFLDEWANAVNAHSGFGRWVGDVSRAPGDIQDILARHA